ncbi:MAG TPA: cob(I)yrinic acid a,c-diamide adenosyltransferase [Candidatus Nanoarchaeia archaeon]|nr:cob(I)yrinic acid a,c-diamide adenosyltransferase [Candidatus Nanoarchaeia archaeon]
MKIYTKVGDKGKTHLFGCCGMVQKDDSRIEAVGALDELNSVIGVSLNFVEDDIKTHLKKIQNDLFQVGADLASNADFKVPRIRASHVEEMEHRIDTIFELLSEQKEFILPGGTPASSFLHLCRAVARRAERNLVKASKSINLNPELLRYVNRLSDLLFALARKANEEVNVKEQHPLYDYFGS